MVEKSCSRSHGQPLPGVRSCAMMSSRPEISREGVMKYSWAGALSAEVFRLQFDRLAMRRTIRGMIPGVAIAVQHVARRNTFCGDQPLQIGEPVPVIGLAGVGIAFSL